MAQRSALSDTDMIRGVFEELGVQPPHVDSSTELTSWLRHYFADNPTASTSTPASPSPAVDDSPHRDDRPHMLSHQIRLPIFSGDGKGDTSFELWKYEVDCLEREKFSHDIVHHTIRRSLRGEAALIVMRLGPDATTTQIVEKLEATYGEVEQPAIRLSEFFSARQGKDEDVTSWSCRLEKLYSKASTSEELQHKTDSLRVMFWSGLRDDLKDITMHMFDTIMDYDRLKVALRRVEQDHLRRQGERTPSTRTTIPCKQSVTEKSQLDDISSIVHQLSADVRALRTDQQSMQTQLDSFTHRPQLPLSYRRSENSSSNRRPGRESENLQQQRTSRQDNRHPDQSRQAYPPRGNVSNNNDIVCWKCGQLGHVAVGCRVRTDHMKGLNLNRPLSKGGQ